MPAAAKRPSALAVVLTWVVLLWVVFLGQVLAVTVWHYDLAEHFGLAPRTLHGLWGIPCAHVLHASLNHLASNSLALIVLGLVSCWYSRRLTAWAVVYAALGSSLLTWVIAPAGPVHIGASGVIFGLIGFLVLNGLFRGSWGAFALALLVGVVFAGVLPGMLPSEQARLAQISWQMHLGGFLGGAIASWEMRNEKG